MNSKLFKAIMYGLLIAGLISVVVLIIISIVLHDQASIITYIEKELW